MGVATETEQAFYSGHEAQIESDRCQNCNVCHQMCVFDAVMTANPVPVIDAQKCEGCNVCVHFCPAGAISFIPKQSGKWYTSQTRFGPLFHAQLLPGEENSGRLVALLRKKAKTFTSGRATSLIISDGPPGIGCPVISALSGVDLAVIVTEPTPSGFHDLEGVVSLCRHFDIR